MNVEEQIEYDLDQLTKYYELVSDRFQKVPEWSYFQSSARYSIVIDIYGCLEFWLKKICDMRMKSAHLVLSHTEIRGNNGLAAFNKYLKKVACVDMSKVARQYQGLQDLRKIRNLIVHHGAHIGDDNNEVKNIRGIRIFTSLVGIEEIFIKDAFGNTKEFLVHACRN
jgi:hypothetical protein